MLKKTVKYVDFDGNEREEDFYFNLTKSEAAEWELSEDGGLTGLLDRIIRQRDNKKTIEMFKEIILKSYGEKSPDGKYFVKNKEVRERFASTMAYDQIFMEIGTDDLKAVEFINGIMPTDTKISVEDARKMLGGQNAGNNSPALGTV